MQPPKRRHAGFTLVEAVLVIAIIGIIGGIVAVFIRAPVLGYTESAERAAASDEADLALRRIARDLRLALPNSVRVTNNGGAIEFLLTSSGGRYLAVEDDVPGQPVLDFDNPGNTTFAVVGGTMRPIEPGNFIVVYNLGDGQVPADAYRYRAGVDAAGTGDMNIARVTAVDAADPLLPRVTLEDNPFARQSVPMMSPGRRFQVVTTPVTYHCVAQPGGGLALVRYWDYAINPAQAAPPQGSPRQAVIATRVNACAGIFQYATEAQRRSALVILNLALRLKDGSLVPLVHQVHVDNTP